MRKLQTAAWSLGATLVAMSGAYAQEAGEWTLSGDLAAVSDYRWRGVSMTDRDPAVQGEVTLLHQSGFYGYAWASSIDTSGDNVELMPAVGWYGEVGGFTLDAGGGGYFYPGVDDSEIYELYAIVSRPLGAVTATGEFSWMPEQDSIGGTDNRYLKGSLSAPLNVAEASFNVGLGWEDGAYGDNKIDWLAGVSVPLKPFEFRLSYVGTDVEGVRIADDTILAELHFKFGG